MTLDTLQIVAPLTTLAAGVVGAGAVILAGWLQSEREERRRRSDYIRSIRNEPLERLLSFIDASSDMLARFHEVRGNLQGGFSDGVSLPEGLLSTFLLTVTRVGISMDATSAPQDVHSAIRQIPPLISLFSSLTMRVLEGAEYATIEAQLTEVVNEFGVLVVSLEKSCTDLRLQQVEPDSKPSS